MTIDNFSQDLATRDAFPAPYTFKRACQLVSGVEHDVAQCLVAGFQELKLHFFLVIKFRDVHNTKRVTWNVKDFVEVQVSSHEPSPQARAADMTGDICTEIERRSLTLSRNLERYREHSMPWLGTVMARLPSQMGKQTVFKVLIFARFVGTEWGLHHLQAPGFTHH